LGRGGVEGRELDIPEKQICGFIGPNGAGKTTLFSLITGAVRPSGAKSTFTARTSPAWTLLPGEEGRRPHPSGRASV